LSVNAILALTVFIIAYSFIAAEKFNRVAIALVGAATMVIVGATDADAVFFNHDTGIDWNVIFLLLGMMIIVSVIHKTGFFEYLAIKAIKLAKGNPKTALVYLIILVVLASAILDNVTTILLAVPITLIICKKLNVNPVPFLLSEVFMSNIGGAATLVGDPPNIIIASKANLSFNEFLIHMAPLVIIVVIAITPLLLFMFRKELVNTPEDRKMINELNERSFLTDIKLMTKSLFVLSLVIIAFISHSFLHLEPAIIALLGAGLLILISGLRPANYVQDIEWSTLTFFAGLFIMVGALVNTGVMKTFADFLKHLVGSNVTLAAMSLLGVSAVLSGIVDNIPYVASMSPVVVELSKSIPESAGDVLWWALAFGADFGGNATIIGASANVVAVGLAKKAGIHISFWQFAKYGIPVTFLSVIMVVPYLLLRYL